MAKINLTIQHAKKEQIFVKALIGGPSGSGKSYSALRVATGIAGREGEGTKIGYIGTEGMRDKLYANEFDYDLISLEEYSPDYYEAAIDAFLDSCVKDAKPVLSKIRKHDGYTTQNICIELTPGQHIFGTLYTSMKKGRKPLIVCPDGHWPSRYRDDEQQRLATLARMGAVCVDFDLYGYSQSAAEVGDHHTARAHIFQAACGLKLLDYMLTNRKDIDHTRVAANGGSGGGTHTVLLALLDDRITASAPVVHVASHFDGGCPCESGMPVQLAGDGTCEAELAAIIAPKPLLLVSDGGDWTSSNPTLEYPFIQRIFGYCFS